MTDLNKLRIEIDSIDEKLVELLNQRAHCVLEIGRYKQQNQRAVYEPQREARGDGQRGALQPRAAAGRRTSDDLHAILAAMRRLQSPDLLERS